MNSAHSYECSSWILSTMGLCFALAAATVLTCILSYRLQRGAAGNKGKDPFYQSTMPSTTPTRSTTPSIKITSHVNECGSGSNKHHHHHHHRKSGGNSANSGATSSHTHAHTHGGAGGTVACKISSSKYARDTSLYRPWEIRLKFVIYSCSFCCICKIRNCKGWGICYFYFVFWGNFSHFLHFSHFVPFRGWLNKFCTNSDGFLRILWMKDNFIE